jgi:hypothetical protein
MSELVTINTFDDGNTQYKYLCNLEKNKWKITKKMFNGSKVELINAIDKEIKIKSISTWKTQKIVDY